MLSMLSEKESGALRDILFHINATERFAHGQTFESLRNDLIRLYAVNVADCFMRTSSESAR